MIAPDFIPSRHSAVAAGLAAADSRLKLGTVLLLLVMVLASRGLLFPVTVATLALGGCLIMGVPLRFLAHRLAHPLFLVVVVLLLKLLFSGQEVFLRIPLPWGELALHTDGLRQGTQIGLRVMAAVSLVATMGFFTPFTDVMAAMAWFRIPQTFVEVTLFAWRYLFLLGDDARLIHAAQKNRLGYAGYRQGLRSLGALTGALVVKAFDTSQTITTAMSQRGYDGSLPLLVHKPFRRRELVLSLLLVVTMLAVWNI